MKLSRRTMGTALTAAALALIAAPAPALWLEILITPKGLEGNNQVFSVKSQDKGRFREFEITVTQKDGKALPPFAAGRLNIASHDDFAAIVPVSEKRDKNSMTFRFQISPRFISNSSFELNEQAYINTQSGQGPAKYEMTLGGTAFRLNLADFVGTKPAALPEKPAS